MVGAGPAGTHLAIRMARAGFRVTLLDQKRFPRRKPCGEFLSPECLPMLDELGMRTELIALGARRVRGMDLHGYGTTARGTYGPVGSTRAPFDHGFAIRREVLDDLALRIARATPGVEVLEGARVVDLLRSGDGTLLGAIARDEHGEHREMRARFTVGADGLRSAVSKKLGVRRETEWLKRFALVLRWHGEFQEDHSSVHLFPGGYFAVSAVDQGFKTVNLVVAASAVPPGKRALPAFVAEHLERAPLLAESLQGATRMEEILAVGPLAGTTTQQAFSGGALLGDACGYVDPLTGEGLFFAMRGAEILARSLTSALHSGRTDRASLICYERARRAHFGLRMSFSRMLQRGLRYPNLARTVLHAFAAHPGLCDLAVAFAGDYVPARELLRPSVWMHALAGRKA